jgi:hypothetical protein
MPTSRAQHAATAERRNKAIAMRLAGVDYQTIADRLGYASRGAAHTDISRALERSLAQQQVGADLLRQEELLRLDRLQAAVWGQAIGGDPVAVNTALKVIDRRVKLLGLDAPTRVELVTLDAIDEAIRSLTAQLGTDTTGTPERPEQVAVGEAAPATPAPPTES